MLAYIASNGAHHHCRDRHRFARDLMVQEVGFAKLQAFGIKLVAADSPHLFLDDTPTSKLIRQLLGAVSEFDKAMAVAKLCKGARERRLRGIGPAREVDLGDCPGQISKGRRGMGWSALALHQPYWKGFRRRCGGRWCVIWTEGIILAQRP